jgi:hypothetical protein
MMGGQAILLYFWMFRREMLLREQRWMTDDGQKGDLAVMFEVLKEDVTAWMEKDGR